MAVSLIEILLRAKPFIYQSNVIYALWVEGSYATGAFNEDSDIDVWLDISPSTHEEALEDFKNAISRVVTLRNITDITFYSDEPKLAKAKLYINGKNDDNRIELDMQDSSREFIFSREEHNIIILFDKTGAICYK